MADPASHGDKVELARELLADPRVARELVSDDLAPATRHMRAAVAEQRADERRQARERRERRTGVVETKLVRQIRYRARKMRELARSLDVVTEMIEDIPPSERDRVAHGVRELGKSVDVLRRRIDELREQEG